MNLEEDATIECPYCGEPFEVTVSTTEGKEDFIEDCPVCCHPVHILANCQSGEILSIKVSRC